MTLTWLNKRHGGKTRNRGHGDEPVCTSTGRVLAGRCCLCAAIVGAGYEARITCGGQRGLLVRANAAGICGVCAMEGANMKPIWLDVCPLPWCRSDDAAIFVTGMGINAMFHVRCGRCTARSECFDTKEAAAAQWNRRPVVEGSLPIGTVTLVATTRTREV